MGCFRIVTEKDIQQLRQAKRIVRDTDWKPVPSDKRYEERILTYRSGRTTRMTRIANQVQDPNKKEGYPHYTEFYNGDGKKEPFYNYYDKAGNRVSKSHPEATPGKIQWNSHYSTDEGKRGDHFGTHKTAQAILDDLDEALRSVRSRR